MDNSDVSQMQLTKPMLERNKELEAQIKEYKFKGDEQEREIEHLRMNITAMTDDKVSRHKVFKQLDEDIQYLKQRCTKLEKQLRDIMQEDQADSSANQNMMTMHEELSPPEEVRQGLMCSRCLRDINESINNLVEQSSVELTEKISDEDERSMLSVSTYEFSHSDIEDSIRKPGDDLQLNTIDTSNPNCDLVAIYKALLEVQRTSIASKTLLNTKETTNLNPPETQQKHKDLIVTSSTESVVTMSSTSIESSSDCKFNIYDDVTSTEETPTASAKDNLVPPVAIAPMKKESPIMSSQSIAKAECVNKLEGKTSKQHLVNVSSSVNTGSKQGLSIWEPLNMKPVENVRVLTPLKREPLEYLTIAVGIKKKNRRKHRNQITRNRVDLLDFKDNSSRNSPLAVSYHHMGQGSVSAPLNFEGCGNAPSGDWNGSPIMISNQNMSYAKVLRRADKPHPNM